MIDRKKDTAIANPETDSGPRYPYGVVIWQGRNHRIVLDETPPNAQDTSGGTAQYNTQPGGGVFQISGKDGSVIEMAADSGRMTVRGTGQVHTVAGKGLSETVEGNKDARSEGGNRTQTKGDTVDTNAGGQYKAGGGQNISVSRETRTEGSKSGDKHSVIKGDHVSSSDGNGFSQSRGDAVSMHKGQNIQVTEGEWGNYVISGNGSSVFQKSYKMHVDERYKADVHKTYDVKATGVMTIESEAAIRFKVGDSSITIYPDHIHIKSAEIKIGAGGELHLKGDIVKIGGGASVHVKSGSNKRYPEWVGDPLEPTAPDGTEGANVGRQ